jgi:arylsulfatase A-like enzyme
MLSRLHEHMVVAAWTGAAVSFVVACAGLVSALGQGGAAATPAGAFGAVPFVLCLLVPAGILAGLAAGVFLAGLSGSGPHGLFERTSAALGSQDPSRTAALLGGLLFAGIFVALAAVVHYVVARNFESASLKALLAAILMLLGYFATKSVAALATGGLRSVLCWLSARSRIGGLLFRPAVAVSALSLGAAAGGTALFVVFRRVVKDIGDALVFGTLAGAVLAAACWLALAALYPRAPQWTRRLRWWIVGSLLALACAVGLGGFPQVRAAALKGSLPQTQVADVLKLASDLDRDGYSSLFGGGDCEPLNRAVHPDAVEIPNNGIDENCSGADLAVDPGRGREVAYHDLPDGFPVSPNLVFITIDAQRADHMSLYGYSRETTPRVDELAAGAVVFEHAYSHGAGTVSSTPSYMSSLYPYQVRFTGDPVYPPRVAPENLMMGEIFAQQGYATGTVNTIRYIMRDWGITQGFQHIDTSMVTREQSDCENAPQVTEAAMSWVKGLGRKPFLLWVHYYEPHSSYVIHEGTPRFSDSADDVDVYDHEILFTDKHVSELLEYLFSYSEAGRTVVVLTADHGEGFASDRGARTHGYGLYNELVHVPFVVWAPLVKPRRVTTAVGLVDVIPTLCNLAGFEQPGLEGDSLVPFLFGDHEEPDRKVFLENTRGKVVKKVTKALVGSRWKFIYDYTNGLETLTDLQNDPGEKENVADKHPDVTEEFRAEMMALMDRVSLPVQAGMAERFAVRELPPDSTPLAAGYSEVLEVVGLRELGIKGGRLKLELFIRATGKPELPYNLEFGLADKPPVKGTAKTDPLFGTFPVSQWGIGETYRQEIALDVPEEGFDRPTSTLWLRWIWKKKTLKCDEKGGWKGFCKLGEISLQ